MWSRFGEFGVCAQLCDERVVVDRLLDHLGFLVVGDKSSQTLLVRVEA
jgi:hypothetical protein